MASFTLLSGTSAGQSLTTNENGYLGRYASVTGQISGVGDSIDLRVLGEMVGSVPISLVGNNHNLMIGETAVVTSIGAPTAFNGAIAFTTTLAGATPATGRLYNAGQVFGSAYGIFAEISDLADKMYITNTGNIVAETTGIYTFNQGQLSISNSGTIEGVQHGISNDSSGMGFWNTIVTLTNTGTVRGQASVNTGGAADKIYNSGLLQGSVSMGNGADLLDNRGGEIVGHVNLGQSEDQFFNRGGQITGDLLSDSGNDILDLRGGLVTGNVNTGAGADHVKNNTGIIEGDVLLGTEDDLFDNRGGHVSGTIQGDAGNDRLIASADDADVFDGGVGVDLVDYRFGAAVAVALDASFANGGAAVNDVITNVEQLTGSATGADHLRGNAGGNVLRGEGGADTLDGAEGGDVLIGGNGEDHLIGGLGNDTFFFQSLSHLGDTVADFLAVAGNDDRFQISTAGFGGGLVAGSLAAGQFQSRGDNVAQDADDRFIFRTTDKTLWFDVDGNGSATALMVADLQAGAVLTAADFVLI